MGGLDVWLSSEATSDLVTVIKLIKYQDELPNKSNFSDWFKNNMDCIEEEFENATEIVAKY